MKSWLQKTNGSQSQIKIKKNFIDKVDPSNKSLISFCFSSLIKIILIIISIFCWIPSIKSVGFSHWFLYFTNQSNVWIICIIFIFFVLIVLNQIFKRNFLPNWLKIIKFCCTVAITLTMVGYWTGEIILSKTNEPLLGVWTFENITVHLVVPVASIIDFYCFDYNIKINKRQVLFCLVLPFIYLLLQIYVFYTTGKYPYFCLNYGTSLGWFKINLQWSKAKSINDYMGSFYWILIFTFLLLLIGYSQRFVLKIENKIINHKK